MIASKILIKQADIILQKHNEFDYEPDIIKKICKMLEDEKYVIHLPYNNSNDDGVNVNWYDLATTNDDCTYCGKKNSIKTITSEAIRVCNNPKCGKVLSSLLDPSPEWKQYQNDGQSEGMVRCSTNNINSNTNGGYNKLLVLQNWLATEPKERSINKILSELNEKCLNAGIKKNAIDEIKCIYKDFVKGDVGDMTSSVRGLNKKGLLAAITMNVCKDKKSPLLPDELCTMFNLNTNDITNGYRTFNELMFLKGRSFCMVNSSPDEYLGRLAPKLGIKKDFVDLATRIAKNVKLIGICDDATPPSIAAASILLVCQIKKIDIPITTVSEVFGVSTTTSDKTMNKIEKYKKIVIDNEKSVKLSTAITEKRKKIGVIEHAQIE